MGRCWVEEKIDGGVGFDDGGGLAVQWSEIDPRGVGGKGHLVNLLAMVWGTRGGEVPYRKPPR